MHCAICGVRKPRRYCPALRGEICSICCGTEREQSVDCPLDCDWLQEAHRHEKPAALDTTKLPNKDIKVDRDFVYGNEALLATVATAIYDAARESRECTDYDVREALEALVKTYRTLNAGLYYETLPVNPFAAKVVSSVQRALGELKEEETEEAGFSKIRDATVLKALVFLQHVEYAHNNGRRRCRAFIGFVGDFSGVTGPDGESPEPDDRRIIL